MAQNVSIKGLAHPWYAGKIISVSVAGDYITNQLHVESTDTIGKGGEFELRLQAGETHPVFLKVGNVVAKMYVEPASEYSITLPEPADIVSVVKEAEHTVNPGIITADNQELNVLIFDFRQIYNSLFITDNDRFLSRAEMFRLADSLQRICDRRYKETDNPYFKSYVRYAIASVNASVSRGEKYLINGYILNKPVLYSHSEYMNFFNTCFRGYLKTAGAQNTEQTIYRIINVQADFSMLDAFLKKDKFLQNDTLRELVIISNLWEFYFSPDFVADAVNNVITQLHLNTGIKAHRHITSTMLAFFNKMQEGAPAPDFSARTKDGSMGSLGNFKGRWVYLNFFSTKNTESLKEMPKIAALNKKYAGKIVFLSICLDDSLDIYLKYLRSNPKFNWPIWFNSDPAITHTAKEKYFVTGTEAYFLINNTGYLAHSPALSPSRGIEYRFNIIFRIKERTTKTGIR